MKTALERISKPGTLLALVVILMLGASSVGEAGVVWQAAAGVQNTDLGNQGLGFLPNEFWIHAGDSIRWTFASDEIHTVTFLTANQIRPPLFAAFQVFIGCPGATPSGSSFDGSSCVTAAPSVNGQTYSVQFPKPGNFKLACLVHPDMTGVIHVLNLAEPLPHDQDFYNREARSDGVALLADASRLQGQGTADAQNEGPGARVTTGPGEIVANGAGSRTVSVSRFLPGTLAVRVGDTVEWTNHDPSTPHTVTFGTEPADPRPPSQNVLPTPDGARQAVIASLQDSVNSGLLVAAPEDRMGLFPAPLGVTRIRITFKSPGTFNYICSLHDNLGMHGTVIVH